MAAVVPNMDIDPRLLRYFVAVAQELHFGRAAAKLHVSQPALSEAIKRLETDLGVLLFVRGSRRVELTEAGQVLLSQAPTILGQLERTVGLVRGTTQRTESHLRIGYSPFVDLTRVWAIRARLNRMAPAATIEFVSGRTTEQVSFLLKGEIAAGVVVGPVDDPALTTEVVLREPFIVGLPQAHPLKRRRKLRLPDVAREKVIWFPRHFHPAFYDSFLAACEARGVRPRIIHEVTTLPECMRLVANAEGITFITRSALAVPFSNVLFRELHEEGLHVETLLAFRSDHASELLSRFLEAAREEFGSGSEGPATS
jgi:DNA-binding transcriptional LysR family regulator